MFDFRLKSLFASVDMFKFKDGIHFRNSGLKCSKFASWILFCKILEVYLDFITTFEHVHGRLLYLVFYLHEKEIFFLFGFYGPFKNISLISSRSFIEGGRKPVNPEKNHLTIRKQNLAFPHMTRVRLEPQR